jgi:hypothetical protein
MAVSEVIRPQGGRPAAVFYHLGHLTLYAYENEKLLHDGM